jgi:hypothetical protein
MTTFFFNHFSSTLLAEAGSNFNPRVELGTGLNILSCDRAFDFDRDVLQTGLKFQPDPSTGPSSTPGLKII